MTDIIARLHTAVITEVNPIDDLTYSTTLGLEAAVEIERLRTALANWKAARLAAVQIGLQHPEYIDVLNKLAEAEYALQQLA